MEHHGAALHLLTKDTKLVEQLKKDYTSANLDEKTKSMLYYAVKLTKNPHGVTDGDVNILRSVGCTDREILDLCQITSYFNFVNRMAEGLGVELEREYR
jgi:uncharacterized peroxidase-related enzyme